MTVTARAAPLPLSAILARGTSVRFDDAALTVRLATAVSASPTVKFNGPVVPPCAMVWFATSVMVGGSPWPGFLPNTVTTPYAGMVTVSACPVAIV